MALITVDTPNRGKAPILLSDEYVLQYIENLPNVPAGKGLRDDEEFFRSQSQATTHGRKLMDRIVAMTSVDEDGNKVESPYLSANVNDKGERLVKLSLSTVQINGRWTCSVKNWER